MYAIFRSGGKQYKAEPGKVVQLEKLPGVVGEEVAIDQVLLLADGDQIQVGQPIIEGLSVTGKIVTQGRHRKILVFKHKRRKDYRKKQGHRQSFTAVLIQGIGSEANTAGIEPSPADLGTD
jgi:large subunit ribosomal protein L21